MQSPTLKAVLYCIKSGFTRILTQVLTHISHCHKLWARTSYFDPNFGDRHYVYILSWRLLILLPRLLLFKTKRGSDGGARNLHQRISLFNASKWGELLKLSDEARSMSTNSPDVNDLASKLKRVVHYAELGELSHAARELESAGLAPGNLLTLAELQDPNLSPQLPVEPIASALLAGAPVITLDKQRFGAILREARRGVNAGFSGLRNEYLQVCLDHDLSFDALYDVAESESEHLALPAALWQRNLNK